jgi:hypothetical protein
VVGGWAIDLFLGEVTRPHGDLEIAVLRWDLGAVRRQLAEFTFHTVGNGTIRRLGADEEGSPDRRQHWVLDEQAGAWRVDVMIEPGDDEWWVYRRDERIRRRRSLMVEQTPEGIPFLRPEGALLYKATASSTKDEADLGAVLPRLDAGARVWLAAALAVAHPGHPWGRIL